MSTSKADLYPESTLNELGIGLGIAGEGMSLDVMTIDSSNANYPAALRTRRTQALFPRISIIGIPEILKRQLLGLFCSVKCPGDLILRTYDLARAIRDAGVPVISGFHTPIEKDCLDLLLRGSQPVVICPARNIRNMRLGKDLKTGIGEGRVLVLSQFDVKGKRPTAEIAERRNQFVAALATACFSPYAEPGGKTEGICKGMLASGKDLYTLQNKANENLISMGARPIDPGQLAEWMGIFL